MRVVFFEDASFPARAGALGLSEARQAIGDAELVSLDAAALAVDLAPPDDGPDVLICGQGDAFPAACWDAFVQFQHQGGHVIWFGGPPFRRPLWWDARSRQWRHDDGAEIAGRRAWQQMLFESIRDCSWPLLIEHFGLRFHEPLNGRRVARLVSSAGPDFRPLESVPRRSIDGYFLPIHRDDVFTPLLEAFGEDGWPALLVERRCARFLGSRLATLAAALPAGHPQRVDMLAALLKAVTAAAEQEVLVGLDVDCLIARAGQPIAATIRLRNLTNEACRVPITLSVGADVAHRQDVSLGPREDLTLRQGVSVQVDHPHHANIQVTAQVGSRNATVRRSVAALGPPGPRLPSVRVTNARRNPTLVVNGTRLYPAMYKFDSTPVTFHRSIPALNQRGLRFFSTNLSLMPFWTEAGEYDFGLFDGVMAQILQAAPDGYLIPQLAVSPPLWWRRLYPQEAAVTKPPGPCSDELNVTQQSCLDVQNPSLASRRWKQDVAAALRAMVHHVDGSRYADRFIGVHVLHGHAGEWGEFQWIGDDRWYCGDFSENMTGSFRQWLRERYGGDVAVLRKRWGRSDVDFETAAAPERWERFPQDLGTFVDASSNSQVADYYQHIAYLTCEAIEHFCRAIKEASDGRLLTGVFQGYLFQAGRCSYLYADAAQFDHRRLVSLPHLDYVCTPYAYDTRELTTGDCAHRHLVDSIQLAGKMALSENDQRTHRTYRRPGEASYGVPEDAAEAAEVLKRDFGKALIRGAAQWLYDFGLGWYLDDTYLSTLQQLLRLAQSGRDWIGGDVAGALAVIVDDHSLFYQQQANTAMYRMLYEAHGREWGRIGCPFHTYALQDLRRDDFPAHRVFLMTNTFYLTDADRDLIRQRVLRPGNTVVWLYAAGIQSEHRLDIEQSAELTGFRLRLLNTAANGQLTVTDDSHPVVRYLQQRSDRCIGSKGLDDKAAIMAPVVYVDDPDATILGRLEAIDRPGLAVKERDGCRSVFCATLAPSAGLLRGISRWAGVHVYIETGDLFYIRDELLLIVGREAGEKVLRFPRAVSLFDALTGEPLGAADEHVPLTLAAGNTVLLRVAASPCV